MAEQMIGNREVRTAEDAINLLKEKGVGPEAINKIEKMADSPMAKALFNATGLRKEDILADLNRLKNGYTATQTQSTPYFPSRKSPQKDDLAVFKSGLKQFKK